MLLTETGFRLLEQLERQKDVASLLTSFQRLVLTFGMVNFCIGNPTNSKVKGLDRRWAGTWSMDWHACYASQDHLSNDPLVEQMTCTALPFRWSSVFSRTDARRKRVIEDATEFGITDGMAVPIHGPNGPMAGVSIGTAHYELSPQDERALHLASLYLYARMTALRIAPKSLATRSLTPRERECLQWVAAGKTDWEISQILNISEQTAHGYVQSALTKLDARTRAQAVALAMQSAQIQP